MPCGNDLAGEVSCLKNSVGDVGVGLWLFEELSDECLDREFDKSRESSTAKQCSIARTRSVLHPCKTSSRTYNIILNLAYFKCDNFNRPCRAHTGKKRDLFLRILMIYFI